MKKNKELHKKVRRLRKQRYKFHEIGKMLGISMQRAAFIYSQYAKGVDKHR